MATTPVKSTPRDAQVMAAILKDCGVVEYEQRLINQMLDFTYRYVSDILEDAKLYSQHANKKSIDVDDVKLAVQCRTDQSLTNPPPKDLLQDLARHRNNQPLPAIKPYGGPRSIPDRYCLTNPNYRLKTAKKPQARIQFGLPTQQRISLPAQGKGVAVKSIGGSGGQSVTVLPKASPSAVGTGQQLTIISKPTVTPKPTTRINTGPVAPTGIGASGLAQLVTTPISSSTVSNTSLLPTTTTSSTAVGSSTSSLGSSSTTITINPLKRKAEDDDYDG